MLILLPDIELVSSFTSQGVVTYTVDTPNFLIGCNRLQPIGMLGVSPNYRANGSITSNTSVLLASRREFLYRL